MPVAAHIAAIPATPPAIRSESMGRIMGCMVLGVPASDRTHNVPAATQRKTPRLRPAISGTFASQNGRAGTISGTIEGATMTSEMVFTDDCAGTATSTMEVAMDGGRLVGTYLSTDCYGELPGAVDGAYDGTVDLLRQP